jgi:oligopeptide transport system substrate-binding protein
MKFYILILPLILLITSCENKKIIHLGLQKGISSIDPAKGFDGKSLKIISQSYETLYEYHYLQRPYKLIPLLAEGYPEWSNDRKTLKIKIKRGIIFHDHPAFHGKERILKAQDFVTQIKRIAFAPTKSPGHSLLSGTILGFDKFSEKVGSDFSKFKENNIEGLRTPDDFTLYIDLKKSIPNFTYFLTLNFFSPIPLEVFENSSNNLDEIMVGTGPFFLFEKSANSYILKKFPKYRVTPYPQEGDRIAVMEKFLDYGLKPIPFLDEIHFHIFETDRELLENFIDKKLDILEDFPVIKLVDILDQNGNLKKELKDRGILLKRYEGLTNSWLAMNMREPLFSKNKNLRLAIAHAIDIKKYNQYIRRNISMEANSILTPGIPGYDPTHSFPFYYDLKLAKKYLIDAGYPKGKGLPVLVFSTRTKDEASLKEGEFFKHQLEQIGIKLEIRPLDFPEFLRKGRNGELQLFSDNWIYDFPDPLNILQLLVSKNFPGINKTGFINKKYDRLFEILEQMPNDLKRKQKLLEIERIFDQEVPWVMLSYGRSIVLLRENIKNYRKSDLIKNYFKYLDIK